MVVVAMITIQVLAREVVGERGGIGKDAMEEAPRHYCVGQSNIVTDIYSALLRNQRFSISDDSSLHIPISALAYRREISNASTPPRLGRVWAGRQRLEFLEFRFIISSQLSLICDF
jgi:hypothetical protein